MITLKKSMTTSTVINEDVNDKLIKCGELKPFEDTYNPNDPEDVKRHIEKVKAHVKKLEDEREEVAKSIEVKQKAVFAESKKVKDRAELSEFLSKLKEQSIRRRVVPLKEDAEGYKYEVKFERPLKESKQLKEDLSYGEIVDIETRWNEYKKEHDSNADTAHEFIDELVKLDNYKEYDNEDGRDSIFGLISVLEESCKSKKPLKETFAGQDVIDDLVERAQSMYDDGGYGDKDECIHQAIDDGLIYTRDIYSLLEHYGSIENATIIESYYNDLFSGIAKKIEDKEDDEEELESLKKDKKEEVKVSSEWDFEEEDKLAEELIKKGELEDYVDNTLDKNTVINENLSLKTDLYELNVNDSSTWKFED